MMSELDNFKNAYFKSKNCQEFAYKGKPLRVGTLFSGIGAFEHALELLSIPHELVFACDNGGIILEDILKEGDAKRLEAAESSLDKLAIVESVYSAIAKRRTNHVRKSFLANYPLKPENFYHDVRYLTGEINQQIDVLVGGSPCQSFSMAGARGGFEDTRGTLFFEYARCVKEFQPEMFIYENVKGLINHDKGKTFKIVLNTFDELGYKYFYKVLNARHYGIPQNRERIFVIGFKDHSADFQFPEAIPLQVSMADFLQGKVDAKYYLTEHQRNFVRRPDKLKKKYTQINGEVALCQRACQQYNLQGDFVDEKYFLSDKLIRYVLAEDAGGFKNKAVLNAEIAKTLLASMHKMHRASIDNYVTVDSRIRKLTPRECLRLMGFCDSFEQVVSDNQMYRQAGNSIVVDVLMALVIQMLKARQQIVQD